MASAASGRRSASAPTARLGGVPLELLLTAVRGPVILEVDEPRGQEFASVRFVVDGADALDLARAGNVWLAQLDTRALNDGTHRYELQAKRQSGRAARVRGTFRVRTRAR